MNLRGRDYYFQNLQPGKLRPKRSEVTCLKLHRKLVLWLRDLCSLPQLLQLAFVTKRHSSELSLLPEPVDL